MQCTITKLWKIAEVLLSKFHFILQPVAEQDNILNLEPTEYLGVRVILEQGVSSEQNNIISELTSMT